VSPRLRRPSPRLLMFVAAIVLALLAAWLVKVYLDRAAERLAAEYANKGEMIEVVVPRVDVPLGAPFRSEDFAKRNVLADTAPPDAVRVDEVEQAEGQAIKVALPRGRPLLWSYLSSGREPSFSETIDTQRRALTIAIDELNSISGMVRPSDRIDLFFIRTEAATDGAMGGKVVVPLLQNVLVKATGNTTRREVPPGGGAPVDRSYSTLTLDLDPTNVGKVILAQEQGALKAVLKLPSESAAAPYVPTTMADLGGRRGTADSQLNMIAVYIGGKQQGVLQPTYTEVGGAANAGRKPDEVGEFDLVRNARGMPAAAAAAPPPAPAAPRNTVIVMPPPPARNRF